MKTMKQVLAEFQRMQKQLCGKFGRGIIDVKTYDQGNGYWSVSIHVSRLSENGKEHEVWEDAKWTHYGLQDEENEAENEKELAAFKEKLNIK